MVPHAKIQKGDTVYLLIRYGDRFRFVTVNNRLTEAMERHILSAPCEDSELDMLRLTYERLPVKDVWSYAMSSTEAGSGLLLYVHNEVRSYRIYENYSAEEMSLLLEGISKFGEVEPPVEPYYAPMEDWRLARQNPWMLRLLKPFTYSWNVFAVVCAVAAYRGSITELLPVMLCVLVVFLSLLLYLLLPQYYSFLDKDSYKAHGYTAPVLHLHLLPSMLIPCAALWWRAVEVGYRCFPSPPFYYGILFLILTCIFLKYLSREARQHAFPVFLIATVMFLYGIGATAALNRWQIEEPPPHSYEVMSVHEGPPKSGPYCLVKDGDGHRMFHISDADYEILQPGDSLLVIHNTGRLGIYYEYVVGAAD